MKRTLAMLSTAALLAVAIPAAALELGGDDDGMLVTDRGYDADGRLLWERGIMVSNPLMGFMKHYLLLAESTDEHHNPGHGGGPGGGGGGGGGGGTDCTATQYKLGGWHWTSAYSAKASSYASVLNTAGNTWDAETSFNLFGGITSGSSATAGDQDFVNQMDWAFLGSGGTIAVTTTWYYRGSGEAVESDAEYNTYYPWATNGDANSMDVENIGTHEIGHTFGLGHPNGGGISCLTMYAYADYGETQKRTLGDGDILGIQAIYGV